uniref:Uncharacterized protein n=1 Tax=Glossina palpalis gambiensis TaxID=67801 RepID=A0A1B0BRP0_9MUSC
MPVPQEFELESSEKCVVFGTKSAVDEELVSFCNRFTSRGDDIAMLLLTEATFDAVAGDGEGGGATRTTDAGIEEAGELTAGAPIPGYGGGGGCKNCDLLEPAATVVVINSPLCGFFITLSATLGGGPKPLINCCCCTLDTVVIAGFPAVKDKPGGVPTDPTAFKALSRPCNTRAWRILSNGNSLALVVLELLICNEGGTGILPSMGQTVLVSRLAKQIYCCLPVVLTSICCSPIFSDITESPSNCTERIPRARTAALPSVANWRNLCAASLGI